MSAEALKDLATAALALLYATECAVSGAVSSAVSGGRLRVALSGRTKTRVARAGGEWTWKNHEEAWPSLASSHAP